MPEIFQMPGFGSSGNAPASNNTTSNTTAAPASGATTGGNPPDMSNMMTQMVRYLTKCH